MEVLIKLTPLLPKTDLYVCRQGGYISSSTSRDPEIYNIPFVSNQVQMTNFAIG